MDGITRRHLRNNPQQHVSLNIFDLIDSICRDFRSHWKEERRPNIEEWFRKVPEQAQPQLFNNLLDIELRYRRRLGETPNSSYYLQRFPKFASKIRSAFDESTMGSEDQGFCSTPDSSHVEPTITRSFELPAANRIGEYELIRELGRGGFGVVYEAVHLTRKNRAALKTLPTGVDGQEINADRLHKFRREFRSLSEINHPNLVGMQTLEVKGSQWFFTMDLIEGTDFLSYVRPNEHFDLQRLRSSSEQLATGIIFLHEHRIIHRDLKPSNVLVDESGRVVILDFGLVAQLQSPTDRTVSRSGMFAGTPRYAAPEQMFGERSEASDWYAFGTMLYEAITGMPPFTGKQMELLNKKQNQDPPKISGLPTFEATGELALLTDGLLKRDPDQRLKTDQIVEFFHLDHGTRTSSASGSTGSIDDDQLGFDAPTDDDITLVGREKQIARLRSAKQVCLNEHKPVAVWISGLSGEGKSSLVESFLRQQDAEGEMLVLSGRCYDRESVPFKAIDCWMDPLVSFLRSRSDSYLERVIPDDFVGMANLFPVLRRIQFISNMPTIDNVLTTSETLRHRSFVALRDLLKNISKTLPVVLFVDDLQWGDADSVIAYERILNSSDAPTMLFLGSYRSDEKADSAFFQQWDECEFGVESSTVTVGPLNLGQSLELVKQSVDTFGQISEDNLIEICKQAEGNPFLLQQMLEGFDAGTNSFDVPPLESVIEARLQRLPNDARTLLELLAVAGQAVSIDDLVPLTGSKTTPYSTLTRMRNERLIRLLGHKEHQKADTFHDQIRANVLGNLTEAQQVDWHRRIAVVLESLEGESRIQASHHPPFDEYGEEHLPRQFERLFDMAYHFHGAKDPRAIEFLLLAGEQALGVYSNEEALEFLSRARQLIDDRTPSNIQFRVLYGMGLAMARSRRVKQATDLFEASGASALEKSERLQMNRALGIAYGNLGQTQKAIECLDSALSELGRPRPQSTPAMLIRIFLDVLRILTVPNLGFKGIGEQEQRKSITELRILERLKFEVVQKHSIGMADCGVHSSVAAYQSGDPILRLFGHSTAALMFCFLGLQHFSKACHRRLLDADVETGLSPEFHASALWNESAIAYIGGEFDRLYDGIKGQIEAAVRCGDNMSSIFGLHLIRHADAWTKSTSQESNSAQREHELAVEIGDEKGLCWSLYGRAEPDARAGQFSAAAEFLQQAFQTLKSEPWICTEPVCRSIHGYFLMQTSNYERAASTLSIAWEISRTHWAFNAFNLQSLPLFLESLLGPAWKDRNASANRKLPRTVARWIKFLFRSAPVLQPAMLRSLGRHAAWEGKNRKAIRYFKKAENLTRKRGMPYHRARVILDLATIEEHNSEDQRKEAVSLLKQMESVIPRAESWLLGDQYCDAVVAPEFDLEAWEQENGSMSPELITSEKTS